MSPHPHGKHMLKLTLLLLCFLLGFWKATFSPPLTPITEASGTICRPDTFSLGVCNGCQLMALLGWVPGAASDDVQMTRSSTNAEALTTMADASTSSSSQFLPDLEQPRFIHNTSGRFECRWTNVQILDSPAVMLKVSAECDQCVC